MQIADLRSTTRPAHPMGNGCCTAESALPPTAAPRPEDCTLVWCTWTDNRERLKSLSPAGFLGFATDLAVPPYFFTSGFDVSEVAVFQSHASVLGAANIGTALGFRVADVNDPRIACIDKMTGTITLPTFALEDNPDAYKLKAPQFTDDLAYIAWGAKPLSGPWSGPDAVKTARQLHDVLKAQDDLPGQ